MKLQSAVLLSTMKTVATIMHSGVHFSMKLAELKAVSALNSILNEQCAVKVSFVPIDKQGKVLGFQIKQLQ